MNRPNSRGAVGLFVFGRRCLAIAGVLNEFPRVVSWFVPRPSYVVQEFPNFGILVFRVLFGRVVDYFYYYKIFSLIFFVLIVVVNAGFGRLGGSSV